MKRNNKSGETLLSKNNKKLSKITNNLIQTLVMLVAVYIVVMICDVCGIISYSLNDLMVMLCIYSIAAVALNLCVGYLGELSLGHAAFMSLGAFTSALFTNATKDTIENDLIRLLIALLIGVAVAALFGFLIGIPVLRLNGDYLAIVTLAFGEIVKGLINVLYVGIDSKGLHFAFLTDKNMDIADDGRMIINGAKGISGTQNLSNFTLGMIVLILAVVVCMFLVNSRTGRAIQAIRDNRIAAESVGINITKYKLIAFTVSAAIAGSAGVLYSHYLSSLTASKFDFNMSILLLVFVVLGGIGSFRGSIIAAVVLTALPELLRGLSNYRMLIYAIILIVMMLVNWAPSAIELRHKLFSKNDKKAHKVKEG